MTATFVMMHFLITLNGLRYFVEICIHVVSFCTSAICRFWICWCWVFIIDERTFAFLTGTILVPVETELVRTYAYIYAYISKYTYI